jgi:hypothetical protein
MELTIEQIKDMILFCRDNGVATIQIGSFVANGIMPKPESMGLMEDSVTSAWQPDEVEE